MSRLGPPRQSLEAVFIFSQLERGPSTFHYQGNSFANRSAVNRANWLNFTLCVVAFIAIAEAYYQFSISIHDDVRVMAYEQ
jgi:hypothetical protein